MDKEDLKYISSSKIDWDHVFQDPDFINRLYNLLNEREARKPVPVQNVLIWIFLIVIYSTIIIRITLSFVKPY